MLITFLNTSKYLLTFFFIINCLYLFGQKGTFTRPTGTYVLQNKTTKKDGEIYGYFGTIQVKAISHNNIVMTFYICKGAPSYNSGSFVATLNYTNNIAIYKDSDCITTFTFTTKGVDVKENETNRDCWGHGVYAHGHFKKQSSNMPVLIEPLTGEKVK